MGGCDGWGEGEGLIDGVVFGGDFGEVGVVGGHCCGGGRSLLRWGEGEGPLFWLRRGLGDVALVRAAEFVA